MVRKINRRGLMFVLSSPSGAGKTTLAKLLLQNDKHIHSSISYTTRAPREGEAEGVDYHFTDKETFQKMIDNSEFLEYAEVFGNFYGTPKALVEENLSKGEDVVFDIDWQGNRSLIDNARSDVVSVFILPPSKAALKERLIKRAQDASETIELRMSKANSEMQHWQEYDYIIVNKDLNRSFKKLLSILRAERLRKHRRIGVYHFVSNLMEQSHD
ncbi:MAG: gmk [Candidatus Midichloriaceae bacterium]|jgi:guanylate kinase|nr:gmk [Candidatus Midichloriaceae bacterium]